MKKLGKIIKIVALVGLGFAIVKALKEGKSIKKVMATYDTKLKFNSQSLNYEDEVIDQKSVALLCSSANLDFSQSTIENKQGILDVFGRFSAIKVKVPNHWKVHLDGIADNSAVQNTVEEAECFEDGPVLNIHYDLKMSALAVVNTEEAEEEHIENKDVEALEVEDIEDVEDVLE